MDVGYYLLEMVFRTRNLKERLVSGVIALLSGWQNEKKTRAYDYMKFTKNFTVFLEFLGVSYPFSGLKTNGKRVCDYLHANTTEADFWATL